MKIGIVILGLIILVSFAYLFFSKEESPPQTGSLKGDYQLYFSQVEKGKTPHPDHLDTHFCAFLSQAKKEIKINAFDIDLPCVEEVLSQAHKNKLKVQIVTDSDNNTPEIKHFKKIGIPVVFDKRSAFMHNKFVILDKKWVWTGSFNPTLNGARKNNNHALWFKSKKLAKNYISEFDEMFIDKKFGPRSPAKTPYPKLKIGNMHVENYFSPEDDVKEKLQAYLKTAKKSIYFMAFSFTDKSIGKILKSKSKQGLKISGIFEKMGAKSKYSQYNTLRRAKIDVKMDGNPRVMHHKAFIVDDKSVWVGSYNFSKNADRSNDENVMILHSPEIAKAFKKEYKKLYALTK